MQRLILLRHGKAEATSGAGGDFERGLTDRGRRESATTGEALARAGITPDLVLVSTARRAMETWEAARAAFPNAKFAPARELYHASPGALKEAIDSAGRAVASLMIVGHNPGLHELAVSLGFNPRTRAGRRLAEAFPTAAAAVFEKNRQGRLKLDRFLTPARGERA
ncbi:MAG TPA: histidine phosphatase family protein [Caulobacteraceae bacterium]|nr:histidine phosphatase family protein [Caulobacteraceae bacterium]